MGQVRQSARSLACLVADDTSMVEKSLVRELRRAGLGGGTAAEARSWRASIPVLARDLIDAGLGDIEVLLEYQLPMTSRRADAVLAGVHPKTGQPSYLVVELKQWTEAHTDPADPELVYVPGARYSPVLHPMLQVHRYADQMLGYVRVLSDSSDPLQGAAYLHNADDSDVNELHRIPEGETSRLFTGSSRGRWLEYLASRFAPASGARAADALVTSPIAPSPRLLQVAADEIRQREQFVLLDEQQVAFRLVLDAVERARREDHKTAVIVTGGPGTGKSVIALSLLGELARQGRTVVHATGSKAFTQTLKRTAGKGSTATQSLFKYFNNFMSAEKNGLDVVIADEAHRIRLTSAHRYTSSKDREATGDRRQVDELLDAARVPVFLLDEHQVVRPGEMGTVADIKASAAQRGLDVRIVNLNAQYRAGGSEAYLAWILTLLGLEPAGGAGCPPVWVPDDRYEVRWAATPSELERELAAFQAEGHTARMTAGFCWPWSEATRDQRLVDDVVIGDWRRPWNAKSDRRVGDVPPSSLWATDPNGFGQVGCIYTAQGFEYDWNGVIFGPDLVWRTDHWVAVREANCDRGLQARSQVDDAAFELLVKHVYKVLLTRGMIGTVLYSTDPETNAMLRDVVPVAH